MKCIRIMSLKKKMVIAVSVLVLSLFLLCASFLNIAFKLYNKTIFDSKAGEISANMQRIEDELNAVELISEEYMTQQSLQNRLEEWSTTTDFYTRTILEGQIRENLMGLATRKKYIKGIMLADTAGKSIKWERETEIDKEIYDRIMKASIIDDGSNYWIEPEENGKFFTSVRAVRRIKDRSFKTIGRLYILVDIAEVVSDSCKNAIDDGTSLVIYGKSKIYGSSSFEENNALTSFLNDGKAYDIITCRGTRYFFVSAFGEKTSYRYIAVTDMDILLSNIKRFNILVMASFAIILLALLAAVNIVLRKLLRRLEILCDNMKEMEKGNLSVHDSGNIPENSCDEVDILTKRFYSMAEEIDYLINENYKKVILFRETQLKLLHSQIKPHFLYNTLETINWMAISNGQKNISLMVKALGNLLRSSIGKEQHVITVKDETALLKDYILIQKNRFGEALSVSFDVDDDVSSYSVPKMSLQILVENSIKHVLEKNGGVCIINVRVKKCENELFVSVDDNGGGIPQSVIDRIKNGEYETNSGIGLKNIEKRIKLIYGEEYGIEITNKTEGGALVTMCIPAKPINIIKKCL